MAIAIAVLLTTGCQEEVIDRNEPADTGQLKFAPSLGEAQTATRAGESDNVVLQAASAAGGNTSHIKIETYTGTPGSSLEKYFSDELGYSTTPGNWDVNSGTTRFLPAGGMHLYSYFATNTAKKGDLTNITYTAPTGNAYPKLNFTVEDDAFNQVDLIAAKVEGITSPEIVIPFRHILSQINFGVKGIDGHQIIVSNIRITNVENKGSFDYKTWGWTPDADAKMVNYSYHFPNRKKEDPDSGLGKDYQTQGTPDDSKNTYLFGDGGKFGPGSDTTFLYAQADVSNYATKEKTTTPLHNSVMLLPQAITKNADATVTFDYEIKSNGQIASSATDHSIPLKEYYDWEPNYRYVYLFNFDNPSEKVTLDVIVEKWQTYNGGDGIVGTDELNAATLFQKYIRPLQPGESYSVPLGELTADFNCDWSKYALDSSFLQTEKFTISFGKLPFAKGKSVIIQPPFGFRASTNRLQGEGEVTFTAIHTYFTTSAQINGAISAGGNLEFSVSDAVKLESIHFVGSATGENSLTLYYPTPYKGKLPSRWQLPDTKTAVCYPKDYVLTKPYSYTIYTVQGLKAVFDWMNGGQDPGANTNTGTLAERMQTNITLAKNAKYDLANIYKSSGDASKPQYIPIGNAEATPYTGTFNGNGATVENLSIDINSTAPRPGLIGYLGSGGTVQFVNMTNVSILNGAYGVGGVAGANRGIIRGCSVSGKMHADGYSGGIAGENYAPIFLCASTAQTTSNQSGWNGGIAGYNGSTIQGCYSTGTGLSIFGIGSDAYVTRCFYVAPSDIGIYKENVITRVPSTAALNGKIPQLNAAGVATGAHFVSGYLDETPPSIAAGDPAGRTGGGVLKGTFIQNWFALYWDEKKWDEEMALLATLGMEYLVIDQVVECYVPDPPASAKYMAWYPVTDNLIENKLTTIEKYFALEKCMTACRAHGIKLFIGTFFDKRYWDGSNAVDNPTEWKNCITTSNNIMKELTSFYFNETNSTKANYTDVLAGWYFPYEVNDFDFKTSNAQNLLKDGIRSAIACRDGLTTTANKPYLFSPFMNGLGEGAIDGTMNATEYATLWTNIIKETGFRPGDILSPQDCIGTQKLTIADLDTWMPALKNATTQKGVEFWVNVELFDTYKTNPPTIDRIKQQIKASKDAAAPAAFISFSYPIHWSIYSKQQEGDHNAYKAYYDAQ